FSLLSLCLNATPLGRGTHAKGKVTVNLEKQLGGTVTFEQFNETSFASYGQFEKGFTENNPSNYFILLEGFQIEDFVRAGIVIHAPSTEPFFCGFFGYVSKIIGKKYAILHNDGEKIKTIASGIVKRSS
ncbi:9096_t:CDS:1, partial [Acaulospora colombiana]